MNEKSPESRHAEHDLMYEEYRAMGRWREEFTNTITQALATYGDVLHQNAMDMQKQLASLERGIAEKTSMDSGIMVRQSSIESSFVKLDEQNDRLLQTTGRIVALQEQQSKNIDDAHKAIRVVGGRVDKLEKHGGRLALKVIYGTLAAAGVAFITWGVTKILGGA